MKIKMLHKGEIEIGAFKVPGNEKPIFGVMKGNCLHCYGNFNDEYAANAFMDFLADFVGAEPE